MHGALTTDLRSSEPISIDIRDTFLEILATPKPRRPTTRRRGSTDLTFATISETRAGFQSQPGHAQNTYQPTYRDRIHSVERDIEDAKIRQ